jgi:hypothetical protein
MWDVKVDETGSVVSMEFLAAPPFWDFLTGKRVIRPMSTKTPNQTAVRVS